MNKISEKCRALAVIMARSVGTDELVSVLRAAASEIDRLERDAAERREAATPRTDGKGRRQG